LPACRPSPFPFPGAGPLAPHPPPARCPPTFPPPAAPAAVLAPTSRAPAARRSQPTTASRPVRRRRLLVLRGAPPLAARAPWPPRRPAGRYPGPGTPRRSSVIFVRSARRFRHSSRPPLPASTALPPCLAFALRRASGSPCPGSGVLTVGCFRSARSRSFHRFTLPCPPPPHPFPLAPASCLGGPPQLPQVCRAPVGLPCRHSTRAAPGPARAWQSACLGQGPSVLATPLLPRSRPASLVKSVVSVSPRRPE